MNRKGFTLIELLVVISIITILAAISVPQFAKYRVRAYNVTAISDLRNIKTTLEAEYVDLLAYPGGTLDGSEDATGVSAVIGDFLPSNRVGVYYAAHPEEGPQMYVVATKHRDGNRVYAGSSHSSLLYYTVDSENEEAWIGQTLADTPSAIAALPAAASIPTDAMFDGWTAQ